MRTEVAIWSEPGEPVLRGRVVKGVTAVVVDWDSGRRSTVKRSDPSVRFAYEGSQRLEWLLSPGLLEKQFKNDPVGVFVAVIRDERKPIQTATIKRRLAELGLGPARVASAFDRAKADLAKNRHLIIKGASHSWSDVPVDPYADLRNLPPHEAPMRRWYRLLGTPRLKAEQKQALADAIRNALPPRRSR